MLNRSEHEDLTRAVRSLGYAEDLAGALVDAGHVTREGGRAGLWVPSGTGRVHRPVTRESLAEFARVERWCESYRPAPSTPSAARPVTDAEARAFDRAVFGADTVRFPGL